MTDSTGIKYKYIEIAWMMSFYTDLFVIIMTSFTVLYPYYAKSLQFIYEDPTKSQIKSDIDIDKPAKTISQISASDGVWQIYGITVCVFVIFLFYTVY